jgi:DNA excision repair protein ERCC-2
VIDSQRFARADKRAKLPKWINQYITEANSNLSTDMATALSKRFIRSISQPFDHTQTGISLWTIDDIENRQRKEKEEEARFMHEMDGLATKKQDKDEAPKINDEDVDDEYDQMGIDDADLLDIPMDMS